MPLMNCPDCHKQVSDQAVSCPNCGRFLRQASRMGYEYRSKVSIGKWPLLHIATGINADTGRKRIAKGVIAVGDISLGVVSVGGIAMGGICLGGLAVGLVGLGGLAIGILLAIGGTAIGYVAVGGAAIGYYACGGAAFGVHSVSGASQDPYAAEFLKSFLPVAVGNGSPNH